MVFLIVRLNFQQKKSFPSSFFPLRHKIWRRGHLLEFVGSDFGDSQSLEEVTKELPDVDRVWLCFMRSVPHSSFDLSFYYTLRSDKGWILQV